MTSPIPVESTFASVNPALRTPCPKPGPVPGKDQFRPAGESPADPAAGKIFVPG
ncbi:hypothetical protein JOF56_000945 [Kibdelosporangium banguiense]|uniref:Uncharacterized protein n=1 Tax=Kibdelosporangium banguiense TaxID=1365924 RepID=A0ABS4T814_9PSEU|nr:hypothetical protein [Kibdelosporangium banguiense]